MKYFAKLYLDKWYVQLTVQILFFAIILFLLPACYKQNDDIFMSWIASGKAVYGNVPNNHLAFINYLLGTVISRLYFYYAGAEWYSICLISFHFISFYMIIRLIAKSHKNIKNRLLMILLLFAFEFRILFWLQFTTTAALLATTGILLLLQKKHAYLILGMVIFILGVLLRFEAAMLVGFISAAFILLFFKRLRLSRINLILLFILVIFSFLLKLMDKSYYHQNSEWQYYYEYNQVRGKLNDDPSYKNDSNLILSPNITLNDIRFIEFFFLNTDIITKEVLQNIKRQVDSIPLMLRLSNIKTFFTGKILMFYVLLSLLMILIVSYESKKINFKYLFLFLLFMSICIFISLYGRVKMRVFFSMLLPFILFVFLTEKTRYIKYYKIVIIILLIGFCTYGLVAVRKVFMHKSIISEQLELINSIDKVNTVVPIGSALSVEYFPIFKITNSIQPNLAMINCYAPSPLTVNVNNHKAFIDSNIYLFSTKGAYQIRGEMFIKEFKYHYNLETKIQILSKSDNYVLFNFKQCNKK